MSSTDAHCYGALFAVIRDCVSALLLMCVGADLGIVFDTDVDRSAIVDGDGTPINSNRFIALMAAIVLQVSFRRLPGILYITCPGSLQSLRCMQRTAVVAG